MSAAPHAFHPHVLVHILDGPVRDALAISLAPLRHTVFYVVFLATFSEPALVHPPSVLLPPAY
jgi:hypothetical protein